ncbi:hypothetical protein STIAU_5282, partial [Stigmatella aurantiaca DW4/3-1]
MQSVRSQKRQVMPLATA